MEIICEHCGEDFTVSIKKSHRASPDRRHKIVICPNCGKKNFPEIKDLNKGVDDYGLETW